MKENIIFCDGGLANRLNTLIFALILKDKFQGDWAISWPINNWCGADFKSLFEIEIPVYENSLDYYKNKENEYILIMHENQKNFDECSINYQKNFFKYEDYQKLLNDEKPIFYYHNILPNLAEKLDIASGIKLLNIQPEILIEAYSFCVLNKIDDSVLGLHIRKTDFGNTVNDEELFKIVSNSDRKFFVCSDDSEVNDRFSMLKNCSVYKKKTFPTKMIESGSWNQLTTDDQGRIYNFNINRSSDSVKEALVDLLILSKTTHILNSHSTFLKMSMILKAVDYFSF